MSKWRSVPFGDAVEVLKTGPKYSSKTSSVNGTVPVVDQSAAGYIGFHDDEAGVHASISEPVITFSNHTCAVRFHTTPFSVIQNVFPMRPKAGIIERFLFWALQGRVQMSFYGGHFPKLRESEIPVPPLSEQRRIAAILDKADELRAKRREAIAKLGTLSQSIFIDMFGDPATNPMAWKTASFGELALNINNGLFRKNPEYCAPEETGLPVVWVEELFRGDQIDLSRSRQLQPSSREIEKYGLQYGDILFCRSSLKLDGIAFNNVYLGEANKALFESHVIRVSLDTDRINPVFLNCLFRNPNVRAVVKSKSKTATMTTIDQKAICSVNIVLPEYDLQRRFADAVRAIEIQKNRQQVQTTEQGTLFASLQQRAFAGEL